MIKYCYKDGTPINSYCKKLAFVVCLQLGSRVTQLLSQSDLVKSSFVSFLELKSVWSV